MQKEQFGTNFVETCVGLKLPILSVCPHGSEITVQEHPTLMRDASRSIAGQTCRMCVCHFNVASDPFKCHLSVLMW